MRAWCGDQRGDPLDQFQRREQQSAGAVLPGSFEADHQRSVPALLEAAMGQGRAGDVPAQPFQALTVSARDADVGVEVEPPRLGAPLGPPVGRARQSAQTARASAGPAAHGDPARCRSCLHGIDTSPAVLSQKKQRGYSDVQTPAAVLPREDSLVVSIFATHARRLGWIRTTIGGFSMYLSVPLFVFLHFTVAVLMYRFLLAPAFGLKRLESRNYFALDRHKIRNLYWFDRINCLFCGYADGVIRLMNAQLAQFAATRTKPSRFGKLLLYLYVPAHLVFFIVGLFFSNFVLGIIAKMLGLHRGSMRIAKRELYEQGFAGSFSAGQRKVIIFYATIAKTIAFNLEQIESAWCPLKHLEREEYVEPPHHENFLERDNLEGLKDVLGTKGTVSPNRAKF